MAGVSDLLRRSSMMSYNTFTHKRSMKINKLQTNTTLFRHATNANELPFHQHEVTN
jgi:hypothetical protein